MVIAIDIKKFQVVQQQLLFDIATGLFDIINLNLQTDADTAISKRFLHVTEYHIVSCLAEYYQMEQRWCIKHLLLDTFDLLCILSKTAIIVLLGTILPLELTRLLIN